MIFFLKLAKQKIYCSSEIQWTIGKKRGIICLTLFFKLKLQLIARNRRVGVQDMTIAYSAII